MVARLGVKIGIWLWKKKIIEEAKIDFIRYAVEILKTYSQTGYLL